MKAIVHIGAEKTGTTTIQEFCARNRVRLVNCGFLYPNELGSPNQTKLTAYGLDDGKIDDIRRELGLVHESQIAPFRQKLQQSLAIEIKNAPELDTLLLSNEHLQSRLLRLSEVRRLHDFLLEFADDLKVLVYLRRQDRVAVSYYSTRLKAGGVDDERIFPRIADGEPLPRYYDYDVMLKLYEDVFGKENIIVRIFQPDRFVGRELLTDFRAMCGIPDDDFIEGPQRNESLSPVGIAFFRRFNEVVPRFVNDKPNPRRSEIISAVMKEFHGSGPRSGRARAEAFYAKFRESNEAVRLRYFPGSEGELFESDFETYDNVVAKAPGQGEMVDLAIHLWLDRTAKLEEARLNSFLSDFALAVKTGKDRELPCVPDVGDELGVPLPVLSRLVGALIFRGEFTRSADLAERALEGDRARAVFATARGLSLLRADVGDAFDTLARECHLNRKIGDSLLAMKSANLGKLDLERVFDFLRNGDRNHVELYDKCFSWIEN